MAKHLARMDRLTASSVLDPRGVAGIIPVRGPGSRPWELYRKVPELRAGIEWMSNAISRADLHVYEIAPDGGKILVEDEKIVSILSEMLDTGPSQSDMLKRIVFHLEATGETFLVPHRQRGELVWSVASNQEIRSVGDRIQYQIDTQTWEDVDGSQVIRIWHPDPQFAWLAESPVLAMESILLEIISITARTIAVNESRLAGNGLLAFPDTLNVIQPASEGSPNPTTQSRDFITAMEEAMVAPMTDRGLVSSVVPIMFTGPKEDIDAIKRIELWSKLDDKAADQMDQALRRMAISMALPPEIILGLGDTNHWNSFAIIREAIQTAVEPRLDVITSAITESFLRPRLAQLGLNPELYIIGADINDLVVPPDRSEAAAAARAQGLLTDEAWARYQGFEESDIPTGKERERILLERVMFAHPEFAPWILNALKIDVPGLTTGEPVPMPSPLEQEGADGEPGAEAAGTEGTGDPVLGDQGPGQTLAREPQQDSDALGRDQVAASLSVENTVVAAVESAVLRVLERSNQRLVRAHPRDKRAHLKDVDIIDVHAHKDTAGNIVLPITHDLREHMLRGAYDVWQNNMPTLVPIVSNYVDYLYDNQLPHSRELLADTLAEMAKHWPEGGGTDA